MFVVFFVFFYKSSLVRGKKFVFKLEPDPI